GETGYKSFLKLASMTDAEFKEEIGKQIVIGKLADKVTKNVTASEAEAKAYYDTHLSEFGTPREVKVSHILVKTEKEAYDVLKKLEAGADFGDLAQKVSTEPAAKQSKGDLGWVNADTGFVAEFKEAALKLKKGEMTMTPVKTQFGYHIIKAFDEKQANIEKFESVKDEAKVKAKAEKQKTTWSNYVETLKKKAIIKKTLES
ncbi:MAG: peptidylprolyl isomerase, partial [Ignavibacteriales bacterium]